MQKKSVRDIDVGGKRVLMRADFNVTVEDGRITDDSRIRAAVPTIRYLQEQGARVVLCSHLGRPGGKVVEDMRLTPVRRRLSELLGQEALSIDECVGPRVEAAVSGLAPGGVLLLENLRFHAEEEANDPEFARALASLADVFVSDGFGVAHRAHASTEGVTRYLPSVAGFLMEREIEALGSLLESPQEPLVVVLGGAKVTDKIGVIENFLDKVNTLLIGGGMAATFLKAKGLDVRPARKWRRTGWTSCGRCSGGQRRRAWSSLSRPTWWSPTPSTPTPPAGTVDVDSVPDGWLILDIGHKTLDTFKREVARGRTILWNGPMGVFEFPSFATGTRELAAALASLEDAVTVVGGGSTAEAVDSLGPVRQTDPRIYRRGRIPGVPGGQDAARGRRAAGQGDVTQ